jgi:hypothetical protein
LPLLWIIVFKKLGFKPKPAPLWGEIVEELHNLEYALFREGSIR